MFQSDERRLNQEQQPSQDPENLKPVQLTSKRAAVSRLPIDDVVRQMTHHLRDDQRCSQYRQLEEEGVLQ